MGFAQEAAAWKVELPHAVKVVLVYLAFRACRSCGRAYPGVPLMVSATGLGERAVRAALEHLRRRPELLTVYRYPLGGRGVTTEYVVIPELAELSPAACGECQSKGDTLHGAQGKRGARADTLHVAQGKGGSGGENPARKGSKTLHRTQDHPSKNLSSITRALGAREAAAAPPGPAPPDAPGSPPDPTLDPRRAINAATALEIVTRLTERLSPTDALQREPRAPEKP